MICAAALLGRDWLRTYLTRGSTAVEPTVCSPPIAVLIDGPYFAKLELNS